MEKYNEVRDALAKVVGQKEDYGLEDVLRAIDKHTDRAIYLHCNGAIIEFGERGGVGVWEYGKPLSEQSDEVIEFLYSILCKA